MSKDLFAVIKNRRSIRKYKPDMVTRDLILRVLDAANWAPSGLDEQPWSFVVVTGKELDAVRDVCKDVIEKRMPPAAARTPGQKEFAYWYSTLGHAPIAIVACCPQESDPGRRKMIIESVAAAFQNMLLAAAGEGLGTCWMTGPLAQQDRLRQILQIDDALEIVAVTPLGYPNEQPAPVPRKDPELTAKVQFIGF